MNQKGQALGESLMISPVVTSLFMGIIYLFFWVISYFLVDHWAYQSTLCLASGKNRYQCQKALQKNLNKLPFVSFRFRHFHQGYGRSSVALQTTSDSFIKFKNEQSIRTPLKSEDFKRW